MENTTQVWTSLSFSRVCPDRGTESPTILSAGHLAHLVILNHESFNGTETLLWVMEQTEKSLQKRVEHHTLEEWKLSLQSIETIVRAILEKEKQLDYLISEKFLFPNGHFI